MKYCICVDYPHLHEPVVRHVRHATGTILPVAMPGDPVF